MYESYYGLRSKPFQLNPDPAFYFASKEHRKAKAYLDYGVLKHEGFIVITGEIGAGKTTILRGLIDSLDTSDVVVGNMVTTQLGAEDTLRMVGAAFGFHVKDTSKSELLVTLEAFFLSQVSQGKRCLLVVDEAQNLTARAVEELRMLSNYQVGNRSLLQSFLVGQPEFRKILQRPEMEQFRQRIAASCHIGPMDADETRGYIQHRLQCAGATGRPRFDDGVFAEIHAATGGVPRRINALCDRLLMLGCLTQRDHLSVENVAEVVAELRHEGQVTAPDAAAADDGAVDTLRDVPEAADPLDAGTAAAPHLDALERTIAALGSAADADRLAAIERSLLRLEQVNRQILAALHTVLQETRRVDRSIE